jgi:predicted metallopeptidase
MNPVRRDGPSSPAPKLAPGFDFTRQVRLLCEDMTARVEELRHIDMSRVGVSFSQTRTAARHGMYAALTPLRFAGGCRESTRRGRRWAIQRVEAPDGREMLYLLSFYLPRFLDLHFREKLTTVVHELWHISPEFNGDLRRFPGRCFAHGSSLKRYDAQVEKLVDRWLSADPPQSLYAFLEHDFRELQSRHGRVFGARIPAPKLIPLE